MIYNTNQQFFNQIKGTITEIEKSTKFCSITVQVGHLNTRLVNLSCKTEYFDKIINGFEKGNKVICRFYASSNYKFGKWYNSLTLLSCEKQLSNSI